MADFFYFCWMKKIFLLLFIAVFSWVFSQKTALNNHSYKPLFLMDNIVFGFNEFNLLDTNKIEFRKVYKSQTNLPDKLLIFSNFIKVGIIDVVLKKPEKISTVNR